MSTPDQTATQDVQVGPLCEAGLGKVTIHCGAASTPADEALLRTGLKQSGIQTTDKSAPSTSVSFCVAAQGQDIPQAAFLQPNQPAPAPQVQAAPAVPVGM